MNGDVERGETVALAPSRDAALQSLKPRHWLLWLMAGQAGSTSFS